MKYGTFVWYAMFELQAIMINTQVTRNYDQRNELWFT